jgi:hypothetical protein
MTKYLENPICDLTPLFDIDYKKKKNIVCASFFKMAGGGYRNFTEYTKGVLYLAKYVKTYMKDFTLRLFIEKSIYNDKTIMKELNKDKSIEIVLYNCPSYIKDKDKHRGVFGTFVRFFPFFNFNNNDANTVLISDIDYNNYNEVKKKFGNIYNIYKTLNKKKVDLFIINNLVGTLTNNNIFYDSKYLHPYYTAWKQIINKKYDKDLLLEYFKIIDKRPEYNLQVINGENVVKKRKILMSEYIFNRVDGFNKYPNNRIEKSCNKKFVYGIDEYFLNKYLLKYIKKNNLSFGCTIKYKLVANVMTYLEYYYYEPREIDVKIYKNFFNYIFNKIINYKFINLKNSSDLLYNKLFSKKKLEKEKRTKIIMRIYLYFIKIYKTKYAKYFNKPFLKLIQTPEYLGIIEVYKYKFYNSNNEDIIIKIEKLSDENINKLKKII